MIAKITRKIYAIGELKRPLYKESELVADKEYVIKKLGFIEKEFDEIMNKAPVPHDNYPNNYVFAQKIKKIIFRNLNDKN